MDCLSFHPLFRRYVDSTDCWMRPLTSLFLTQVVAHQQPRWCMTRPLETTLAVALAQHHQPDPAQPPQFSALSSSSASVFHPPHHHYPPLSPANSSSRQQQHRARQQRETPPDEFDMRLPSFLDPMAAMLASPLQRPSCLFNSNTDYPTPQRRMPYRQHHRDIDIDLDAPSGAGRSS